MQMCNNTQTLIIIYSSIFNHRNIKVHQKTLRFEIRNQKCMLSLKKCRILKMITIVINNKKIPFFKKNLVFNNLNVPMQKKYFQKHQ